VNYQRFVSAAPQPPAAELQRIYDKVDELRTVGSHLDAGSRPPAVFTGHRLRQYPHDGLCSLMEVSTCAVAKQVVTRQPGARADV
jgi:hypothetical protein